MKSTEVQTSPMLASGDNTHVRALDTTK